jgi:hypothetical protein
MSEAGHVAGREDIPSLDGPLHINEAGLVLDIAVSTIEPVGMLAEPWSGYTAAIDAFLGGETYSVSVLNDHKVALEALVAEEVPGLCLIGAAKCALGAFILAALNPYNALYPKRNGLVNDIMPLVHKGVILLREAFTVEPMNAAVSVDLSVQERMEDQQVQNWLHAMIQTAVRPGDPTDA